MTPEIAEAVESARTAGNERSGERYAKYDARCHSKNAVVAILKSVARDLPADMTLGDLLEELGG